MRKVYRIAAFFHDGSALFLADGRRVHGEHYTRFAHLAIRYERRDDADEHVSRLHGVQAAGHYWREVAYFDVITGRSRGKNPPTQRGAGVRVGRIPESATRQWLR